MPCVPQAVNRNDTISWTKDGESFVGWESFDNNAKLLIREVKDTDSGTYRCEWLHSGGRLITERIITIFNPWDTSGCLVSYAVRPQDVVTKEGNDILLQCGSVSVPSSDDPDNPTSLITWQKDGVDLPNNKTKYETVKPNPNVLHLYIKDTEPSDSGFYSCRTTFPNYPSCVFDATVHVKVETRVDPEKICGLPILAQPTRYASKSKIFNGSNAPRGAYPWQVLLIFKTDSGGWSICGGSLINDQWILSAAHCFKDNREGRWYVLLGKSNITDLQGKDLVFDVQDIITHPEYDSESFDNDIALIYANDTIPMTDSVRPICLPTPSVSDAFFQSESSLPIGQVTGWGQTHLQSVSGGPLPDTLQEIAVPIQPQSSCVASTNSHVTVNMFCAGYGYRSQPDACKGDSGGPFVAYHDGRWYQLGIVSWGELCGVAGKYGFYTRLTNYVDWIKDTTKKYK